MLDIVNYILCLKVEYVNKICVVLKEEFGYKNEMMVFKLDKIVLNIGCGVEVVCDSKKVKLVVEDLIIIVGQKVVIICVKKFIVGFCVCEDMLMGVKVILCGDCMYEFFDCLIIVVMLCICDFCGVFGILFDGCGNYVIGIKEYIVFFEIDFDKVDEVWGMDIVIVIIVKIDVEVKVLLKYFNMLFNS